MIDESKLRPWQIAPARAILKILENHASALDSSDTGTGKTYVALAVAKALRLPCLAVVPKIAISGWLEVARHFDEKISVINYELLRTGKTDYGTWANSGALSAGRPAFFVCCFCQRRFEDSELNIPCFTNAAGIHCVECRRKPIVHGNFKFHQAVEFVIFDEVHRCGGINSLNSKMLIAARRQRIKTLMLSATPAQTVLQMKAIGFSLDLFYL